MGYDFCNLNRGRQALNGLLVTRAKKLWRGGRCSPTMVTNLIQERGYQECSKKNRTHGPPAVSLNGMTPQRRWWELQIPTQEVY